MNEKVLLIDDHTLFRAGLEDLLTRRGIQVVAAVGNGDEGLAAVNQLNYAYYVNTYPVYAW
jgi:two-component system nitrate/nitrite response regulator NarL